MIQAIKSLARPQHSLHLLAKYLPSPAVFRGFPAVGFRQVTTVTNSPKNMEKTQNPNEKAGDVMSHSFGEGYATRSDEEGFGGVYNDQNQAFPKTDGDRIIQDVNQPGYDKSQGSEVKEKEQARHQTNV